jgi:hypothetical protein
LVQLSNQAGVLKNATREWLLKDVATHYDNWHCAWLHTKWHSCTSSQETSLYFPQSMSYLQEHQRIHNWYSNKGSGRRWQHNANLSYPMGYQD